ncbi:MAG: hypothetical protein D4R64_17070 [Porphyromonadaceae bacterium]|nr:MAG: hypothetical protein D4R64_17070 [Porphyromonadaceae bacterium]
MADRSTISPLYTFIITCALSLEPCALYQQSLRTKVLSVKSDTVRIDTLSLVPNSWKILKSDNQSLADSLYTIDWVKSLLIFKPGILAKSDSILVKYEVYPLNLNKVYLHKSPEFNRINPPVYRPLTGLEARESFDRLSEGSLRSSGSLSRGVAMGNTRDASLTSNLNLQLEGRLNKDYRIEATLTDANIPIQPEGNTQQIQEFDKMFFRIYSPRNEILAGDFDIRPVTGYFLQMNKRVQGARFTTETAAKSGKSSFRTSTGAAVVKGKYARNHIQGSEGNQGPYMLSGSAGENYIQIIAGSEKIFIDGQPLMRGEEADYTIDYNTAEIRFTPKILITKDKRIAAEFEYTERSYSRFLFYNENRWSTKKGSWYLSIFSENDAKNQPLLQDLTDANKQLLASIGDNSNLARVSAIRESLFRNDRVFYKLADTTVNGIRYDSILIQSFNPDSAKYEAGFSFVGAGNGNYEPLQSAANGRVFRWLAPENGILKGGYEPVTKLVMPQSKQVLSAGTRQSLGSRMWIDMEWSVTRNDRNTFSSLDDGNNTGMGLKTNLSRKDYLKRDSSLLINTFVNYRFTGMLFDPVERFREVEFERDWNLPAAGISQQENFVESGFKLTGKDSLQASYRLEYLNLQSNFNGFRQFTNGRLRGKKWVASWSGSYLLSADSYRNTSFFRHTVRYRRQLGKVNLEVAENAENNRWKKPENDTLLANSQAFQEFRFEVSEKKGDRQPWMVRISRRTDQLPWAGRLISTTRAWDAESWVDLSKNPALPFRAGFHLRALDADSGSLAIGETGKTITGRIENRWQAWKGFLRSQTFFEMGSGYDRKPEYSYLEVAAGQGYYTWKDYNGNGIKEFNEFETAFFRDQAAFIRIFRLGTEFIPTLVNRFNQVFTIQPKKGFASRFTSQLAYRIDKKTPRGDYLFLVNPFTNDPNDQRLINLNSQLRHSLSFNRTGQKFNADLVTQKQSTRTTLLNGADGKVTWSNSLLLRYRFHPAWQLNSNTDWSRKESVSEFFTARNYILVSQSQLLQIECQAGSNFRIGIDWEFRSEKNKTNGGGLLSNRLETILTAQIPEKGQISLSVQYVYVKFDGQADSPSGYAMLRGFGNGHNGVAQLSARYKLGKNLVLEGVYEGRIVRGGKAVHNAQLQVRAVF